MIRAHAFREVMLSLAIAVVASSVAWASTEIEHQLRDQYLGKTFVLRGFYSGPQLRYDTAGQLTDGVIAGDWTSDGLLRVEDIRVSGQKIKIKASRLLVMYDNTNGFQLREMSSKNGKRGKISPFVEIEVAMVAGDTSSAKADAVLSKIFLTKDDSLAQLAPEYWRPCISQGLASKGDKCRFSSEMVVVPGVSYDGPVGPASQAPSEIESGSGPILHVGHGVKPPKAIYQSDPSYSESARLAKYQGTVVLGLVVTKDGLPESVHVVNPLGCGLDARAVQTVETWKFRPAERDGQPVPVQIAVEVSFRLY